MACLFLFLKQSRELEIAIQWRDWRQMCAVKFLKLEDFLDNQRHGIAIHLEPQGILFAEVIYKLLSHNNLWLHCNIAIMNFLASHRCEIIFHNRSKHCTCVVLRKNSKTWLIYMEKSVCFGTLFFKLICCIQLCN